MTTQIQIIAWADDAALNGRIGNVCSDAAKCYWEKSDPVDRNRAELLVHPLYAAKPPKPDSRACKNIGDCEDYAGWHVPCTNGDKYEPAPKLVLWRIE